MIKFSFRKMTKEEHLLDIKLMKISKNKFPSCQRSVVRRSKDPALKKERNSFSKIFDFPNNYLWK